MILIIYIVISLTEQLVRIATFNVNGVNGLLPVLLRWLEATKPDIECLQELKTPQGNFPEARLCGTAKRAGTVLPYSHEGPRP